MKLQFQSDQEIRIKRPDQICTVSRRNDGTSTKLWYDRTECTTGRERRVDRDVNQKARDYTQALMESVAYKQSQRQRKKIETLFGDVKRNLGLTRLRLRGLTGARDEFLLTATVQNLKRLINCVAIPPPIPAAA